MMIRALPILMLLLSGSAIAKNLPDNETKTPEESVKKPDPRIDRSSSLYSALQYPLVANPTYADAATLTLSAISQSQQAIELAHKQPKHPVYHASPLQPYGALLDHPEAAAQQDIKVIPHQETEDLSQYAADYSGSYQPSASDSELNIGGKLTEAIIPEPKYAPTVYKTQQSASHDEDDNEHLNYAAKYQFGYQVLDKKTGTYFGHTEARDGHVTKGHYHVMLPDGRLQNVQYWADLTGFHAQVSYNGEAKHYVSKTHHHA